MTVQPGTAPHGNGTLDAATRLEPDYGPRMRRMLQEIDRLARLIDLPVAA